MINMLKNLPSIAAFLGGFFVCAMLMGAVQIHTKTAHKKAIAELELAHAQARMSALAQSIATQARLKLEVTALKAKLADIAETADAAALAQVNAVTQKYKYLNTELQNEITRMYMLTSNGDDCSAALSDKLRQQINDLAGPYLSRVEFGGDAGGGSSSSPELDNASAATEPG